MEGQMTVGVPQDLVKPVIEAEIHAAIAKSLGGNEKIIASAVTQILSMKVDSNGNRDSHGYSSSKTLIEWLASQAITTAAKKAIELWASDHAREIEAEIGKQLKKQTPCIARAMIESVIKSSSDKYGIKVIFEADKS
jgi:hypothetical protein